MTNAPRPVLVFDGDCSFCRRWIARWRSVTGERIEYAPYQEAAPRFPEIRRAAFAEAVHFRDPERDGWSRGAEAVFRSLATTPGHGSGLWLYRHLPGFALLAERTYRVVAGHRDFFDRITDLVWGRHVVPPGERRTAWIFLRALGLVYLVAFVSLGVQIQGLVGPEGILPAGEFLRAVGDETGAWRWWLVPTLLWTGAGNASLAGWCAAGTALSVLLLLGFAPVLSLVGLWAIYLSLATVCRDFLWFQWDGLLLEAGFLAIFLAPRRLWSRPGSEPAPSQAALFLLRWLLFRLMVSSAVVKLTSGDATWRSLTALRYHYETQPLPPWTAWYAHHLPGAFQSLSALGMFVIEGLVPFLIWTPRRIRFAGAGLLASLQILILVTGNYGFFNWLTLALCLLLLDDGAWPRRWKSYAGPPGRGGWPPGIPKLAAVVLVPLTLVPFLGALGASTSWLGPVPAVYRAIAPFRTVNSYGLFAVMTLERPEVLLEGSADGTRWLPYAFRYKPGAPGRRPRFVAPHQPRLDWQMWFAALDGTARRAWFLDFCRALLVGSPPVLDLLGTNPFPDAPPRYVRATVYDYRFSDADTRRETGAWWVRTRTGPYSPDLTLRDGKLAPVEPGPRDPSAPATDRVESRTSTDEAWRDPTERELAVAWKTPGRARPRRPRVYTVRVHPGVEGSRTMRPGRIVAIHIHEESGATPFAVEEARLVAGKGIEGDVNFAAAEKDPGPKRVDEALTLIESEALEAARRDYGIELDAADSRRNVLTEGIALNHLVEREFRVGTAVCFGVELCEPCGHLEKMTGKGVVKALTHRGGLRARIVRDGTARPGDAVEASDPGARH